VSPELLELQKMKEKHDTILKHI
jgi:hypothetical protein